MVQKTGAQSQVVLYGIVLDASSLKTQHYDVRIKDKWSRISFLFPFSYFIVDPFKSPYMTLDIRIEWIQNGAIYFQSNFGSGEAIFSETNLQ